ncbi:putative endosome-associated ubiquitin isopeptidase [Morchella snyderi]|nr:putative endosome-associated ubiquitin isopeptidase [Morchella snyderi]
MDTSTHYIDSPPLSVQEISRKAEDFDYSPLIPLRHWLRTAETLRREAVIYQKEGNEQRAYLLLVRMAELLVHYLPKHPDYHRPENARHVASTRSCLREAIARLEYLRPRLEARYDAYQRVLARRASSTSSSRHPSDIDLGINLTRRQQGSGATALEEFERREHEKRARRAEQQGRSVPVDSRGREIRRVPTPVEDAWRRRFVPEGLERYHSDVGTGYALGDMSGRVPQSSSSSEKRPTDEEIARREQQMEVEAYGLAQSIERLDMGSGLSEQQMRPQGSGGIWGERQRERDRQREREQRVGNWQGNYPTVPKRRAPPIRPIDLPPSLIPGIDIRSVTPTPTPPPPPKPTYYTMPILPPPPPPQLAPYPYYDAPRAPSAPALPSKVPAPPAKKHATTDFQFTTPATLENGTPLRTIFLPSGLRSEFLTVAAPNTRRNLETCGILCGTLIQNALFISRLVIPEQESTSDTCGTTDEEGLFQYCNNEDLMVFGWIHTHPTQTCFMSSVDLHTHCSYQRILQESIAIVCAPKHEPSWGVFRLTDPPGVKSILNCRQKGMFHPHEERNVYTDAMRPGHVCEVREMGFEVVDLRKSQY